MDFRFIGVVFFFFKQKTAYEMRISDWSSDVCSSDLLTLSGVADWLACTDKVCVPERAVVSVALRAGDGAVTEASRARFDAWRAARSEERRVGKECVSTGRSRWSPDH